MHINHASDHLCPRTTIQYQVKSTIQFLDGSFLLPNILTKKYVASCTTSVYVNLSKNSLMPFGLDFFHDSENQVNLFFSRCSRSSLLPPISRKRVQRYCFFPNRQNFFGKIFIFYAKFHPLLTNIKSRKGPHIINIYKGRAIRGARTVWTIRGFRTIICPGIWPFRKIVVPLQRTEAIYRSQIKLCI